MSIPLNLGPHFTLPPFVPSPRFPIPTLSYKRWSGHRCLDPALGELVVVGIRWNADCNNRGGMQRGKRCGVADYRIDRGIYTYIICTERSKSDSFVVLRFEAAQVLSVEYYPVSVRGNSQCGRLGVHESSGGS